jgi:hypothetical protein
MNGQPKQLATVSITPGSLLLAAVTAGAIAIGWGLMLAGLLYVVSDFSTTVWLLTTLALAVAHCVLALACWHYATTAMSGTRNDQPSQR